MSENVLVTQPKSNGAALVAGNRGIVLRDIDEIWRFAGIVVSANMIPKSLRGQAQVALALQTGMELGLSPMQSLAGVMVVNNLPSVWGDVAKGLVESSPECEYIKEWVEGEGENMVAHCEAKRKGRPEPARQTFSYADAKSAGLLGKDTYRQYQRRMLQMRARAWALRDQFADLLKGIAITEEALDFTQTERPAPLEIGSDAPIDELEAALDAIDANEQQQGAEPQEVDQPAEPAEISESDKADIREQERLEQEAYLRDKGILTGQQSKEKRESAKEGLFPS